MNQLVINHCRDRVVQIEESYGFGSSISSKDSLPGALLIQTKIFPVILIEGDHFLLSV